MKYNFNEIEAKWQKYWAKNQTFKAVNGSEKPKYYVLDMFPYPSGAGLHVGHPLGYIASDIYARYKRHQGFNVLHPQGYDSFGLPAEQYAIQTGQHPAITTKDNIATYRRQLDQIGFSFDWSREVRTSDPSYYKWTQWIFIQLFNSWYCKHAQKAFEIKELITYFEETGNGNIDAVCDDNVEVFTAEEWNAYSWEKQQDILLKYRLTYLAETEVNWCPALGTVLANDEIVNGVSERGGHAVIRKKMTQWSMRISAYAERLLQGLETIDWTDSLKESQRNWIGKSVGAQVKFKVVSNEVKEAPELEVFTTRPDTIFGVSFMTLAPEHELVQQITTPEQKEAVNAYILATAKRSERDRMADVKTISGVFTGAYAIHPFTQKLIPIWIGDYVLAGYGTGAVMSVPCGDERDYAFAKHFNIPIINIFEGVDISEEPFTDKQKTVIGNSDFLNGMNYKKATKRAIYELEQIEQGEGKTNYRLRDAVFSRQRYWGEPFPVYYVKGMPQMIDAAHLPIKLPEVEKYLPTETGEPPLGNATVWAWDTNKNEVVSNDLIDNETIHPLELNTMPGWAGSSFYFNRYMDPENQNDIASKEAMDYWKDVDLYIGGSEHATGHLLYARFWQKFLFDKGVVPVDEFAKKLINQGMILGTSAFVYKINLEFKLIYTIKPLPETILLNYAQPFGKVKEQDGSVDSNYLVSKSIYESYKGTNPSIDTLTFVFDFNKEYWKNRIMNQVLENVEDKQVLNFYDVELELNNFNLKPIHVKVQYVNASDELDIEGLKSDREFGEDYKDAEFILEDGVYKVGRDVEKMSKSKYNVVNPDDIVSDYGADSLRLYEMFLGPLEQYKPWNTAGITGVHNFLKKLWKLYADDNGLKITDVAPTKDNLKTLHKTIKKVQEDIENFSFNTSVSTFMIAANELTAQKCTSKDILEPLLVLISPYAPHIAEELWSQLGNSESISTAPFPEFDASHLVESSKNYPISFNGKTRFTMELPLDMSKDDIEAAVLANEKTQEQLAGRTPKKVIVVPGKIVNIVG
ncbi:leucine--tRNA ligase [Algibacter amylolyticus]|uniref:Leucine--tRNA ligase n=1 Tax=Algibacter amylolyticus TaxID=1608400 RepID=A0A5M7BG35_9FLAO|nr:class I tRNA ligase family protein [Algibacter amylolyticus]KAA5827893.1 leucine--tRNA ligase [Algibacter amylolyticus]MBB5267124.1 leucyl-tRNA synthetase [Algibacter amylolyticus]TSJ82138.1 leucine--tRNA ligase [Algibacter amylolyticus]